MDRTALPPLRWPFLLGFALGGFFDGILLHQILQWHHLLSLVPGVASLEAQVLWDGLFHLLMYALAGLGIWGLWRRGLPGGARLLGGLCLGFAAWHLADSVLSHWLLGIHRIRVDAANPLAWDLGWLAVFGGGPALLGWALLRRGGDGGAAGWRTAALLAAVVLGSGAWALRPPPGQPLTVALFRPGLAPEAVEAGIERLGGRIVWAGPRLDVALIDLPETRRWALYGAGAVLVSGAGVPAGCLGWSRTVSG
jgi:uncharacterized membrane protein